MKQVVIIKEETNDMSNEYFQLLKGLKKTEILDVINSLQTKVTLSDDYKAPNSHAKKEALIEAALSLIEENQSNADWKAIVKEIPHLSELEEAESEEKAESEENSEEKSEDEEGCKCGNDAEKCECEDCGCDGCDKNVECEDSCCFSYEPTIKERIQWKIYDLRWFFLLQNESFKAFCTSAAGLFKISTLIELVVLFSYVFNNTDSLVYCPKITQHISNIHALFVLKALEILVGYVSIFVAVPLIISYYFNFLPEPEEDEEDLYDSDDEYDDYVAPSDDEDVHEIEEEDVSQEGEDLNKALVEDNEYNYEDLDDEHLGDSDAEDDYDYEDYPNLTLVDEPEKDQYDPFTYSLAKVGVAYICLRYGLNLCEFNNLVILSKLCEVVIGFGIVGALIGLYN
ncbi:uncharacterized protein HGUI_00275 [Hanseniaspora guilliermondii]|uniref:Uncharacterized protein n=1 Tax=Hanseniaspora guilliermondii TaxID=56406 RepID=A0A1L0AZF5_9ASCO|nr:uncharacterized protein HGUI_00275 [Hanseniaspora guilliermondii]